MEVFETSTLLECTPEEAFAFHSNPNNLTIISPPWIKSTLLTPITSVREGDILEIKAKRWMITMHWKIVIETMQSPHLLVDMALRSPFTFWRHSHHFDVHDEGTIMRDVVEFEMPFDGFGKLFVPFVKRDLEKMFAYRHKQTQKQLEKQK